MDLRTYPTRRVFETPPFHCTVCVEPSEPADGFVDIGPADLLCVPCARRAGMAVGMIEPPTTETLPFADAPTYNVTVALDALPCPDCDRTFARPAALGSHRRSHKPA